VVTYRPDRIYRGDRQRESVWEALDAMPAGTEFTLRGLWKGRHGPVGAHYSMVRNVVADAERLLAVERIGRAPSQGGPVLFRRTGQTRGAAGAKESLTPPAGWRRAGGVR
jgi:hypothetical protein